MRYLLAGEPLHTFDPIFDTGILLLKEILSRGISVDYLDLSKMDFSVDSERYLTQLLVQEVTLSDPRHSPPVLVGEKKTREALEYSVILQRKDPPVDETYRGHAEHFSKLKSSVVQMNNPHWTPRLSEHLFPVRYPKYSVPTSVCDSFDGFLKKIKEGFGEKVAKPKNFFSGIGIHFFNEKSSEEELKRFWNTYQPEVIVQPFLKEIETIGDLRILVMNEKVVGSVLRVPKKGSRLGNLHQGAIPKAFSPTKKQLEAVGVISKELSPMGLYLLGFDFIGDLLVEINITCPTTVPQINEVLGIQGEVMIVDELENLRKQFLKNGKTIFR